MNFFSSRINNLNSVKITLIIIIIIIIMVYMVSLISRKYMHLNGWWNHIRDMHDILMCVWFKQQYACFGARCSGIQSESIEIFEYNFGIPYEKPQSFSYSPHLINEQTRICWIWKIFECLKCQLIWNLQIVCWLSHPTSFFFFFFFVDLFTKFILEWQQSAGSNIKIGKNEKSSMHRWAT